MIDPRGMIDIGRYITATGSDGSGLRIVCDAPELERHADKACFRAYAAERLDIPLSAMAGDDDSFLDGDGVKAESLGIRKQWMGHT